MPISDDVTSLEEVQMPTDDFGFAQAYDLHLLSYISVQ